MNMNLLEHTQDSNHLVPFEGCFPEGSAYIKCIDPLLTALCWTGDKREVVESFPHFVETLDLTGLCNTFENLGFTYNKFNIHLSMLDQKYLPCLFVSALGDVFVLLEKKGETFTLFDPDTQAIKEKTLAALSGTIVQFVSRPTNEQAQAEAVETHWLSAILYKYRGLLMQSLILSTVMGLLSVATPLFIMAVYDRVIGASGITMLYSFGFGIAIALIGMFSLSLIRTKILAFIATKLEISVGRAVIKQILDLSPALTESADVGAQVSRIREFDSVRSFITGSLATVIFDFPFTIIFMIILSIIGGQMVIIPVVMISIFILVGLATQPIIKKLTTRVSRVSAQKQTFLIETLRKIRTIKYLSAQEVWSARYREHSGEATYLGFQSTVLTNVIETISDALMMCAGLGVLVFGTIGVINGDLSIGALIASMMIVWKILSPIKIIFNALPRLTQVKKTLAQISKLMSVETEDKPKYTFSKSNKRFTGNIAFKNVSMRYPGSVHASLLGVNFEVEANTTVMITGNSGSGKSSVLKLILRLYEQQAGMILIDGQDIRQIDIKTIRGDIGYVPQSNEFFYGTIKQNLCLGAPLATEKEINEVCELVGVLDEINSLPLKLETRFKEFSSQRWPIHFRQKLAIVRALLRKPAILLLDEPAFDNK